MGDVFPSLTQDQFSTNTLLVNYGAVFGYYICGLVLLMICNSIFKTVSMFMEKSAIKSLRTMKVINVTDDYLIQLIDYVGTVNTVDHAQMQVVYNNERTASWSAHAT